MKDLTPKFDSTAGPTGQYTAAEFNDLHNDCQNAVAQSGQALTSGTGEDNLQFLKAVAVGGRRIARINLDTALVGDIVLPDNSSAPLTVNLPVTGLFVNATVDYEQVKGQLYTAFALTVGRNTNTIMGLSEDFVLNSLAANNSKVRFSWSGTDWSVSLIGYIGV